MANLINVTKLERFYYAEITRLINTQFSLMDVFNKFSSRSGCTRESVFAVLADEEDAGKVFEFDIRGFILTSRAKPFDRFFEYARTEAMRVFYADFRNKF